MSQKLRFSKVRLYKLTEGHPNTVTSLYISNDFLFSGGFDGLIIQYIISSGSLFRRLEEHSKYVTDLVPSDDFLLSASNDGLIVKWRKVTVYCTRRKSVVILCSQKHSFQWKWVSQIH
jgi:WD40 repeat protein